MKKLLLLLLLSCTPLVAGELDTSVQWNLFGLQASLPGSCAQYQGYIAIDTHAYYVCGNDLTFHAVSGGGSGSGTVTSVGLSVPSWMSVANSPVTVTGTLAVTPATGQTAHQFIATCGTATSFAPCSIVPGDLPSGYLYANLSGAPSLGTIAPLNVPAAGIVKSNGSALSPAVSGTDYAPATSGSSLLKANGSGGFSNAVIGDVPSGYPYGSLSGAPSSLPPSGAAGGDLAGSYANPTVANLSNVSNNSLANSGLAHSTMLLNGTTCTLGTTACNLLTVVNSQTGSNYPIVSSDQAKLVLLSNASAQTPTLPLGSTVGAGWWTQVLNNGAGTQTITPTSPATIANGNASISLATNQGGVIVSDGTNYQFIPSGIGSCTQNFSTQSVTCTSTTATFTWDGPAIFAGPVTFNGASGSFPVSLPSQANPACSTSGGLNNLSGVPYFCDGTTNKPLSTVSGATTAGDLANYNNTTGQGIDSGVPSNQVLTAQMSNVFCSDANGSGTTYTCTITGFPASPAKGAFVRFKPGTTSTGASTLSINGGSAISIFKYSTIAITANDLQATGIYDMYFNNAQNGWVLASTTNGGMQQPFSRMNFVDATDQTKLTANVTQCPTGTQCNVLWPSHSGIMLSGGADVVASTATPAFAQNTAGGTSTVGSTHRMILTANVTSWTMSNGSAAGENACFLLVQNATGGFTMVGAPATVVGFFTIGTTASKRNMQCFTWDGTLSLWIPQSAGIINF